MHVLNCQNTEKINYNFQEWIENKKAEPPGPASIFIGIWSGFNSHSFFFNTCTFTWTISKEIQFRPAHSPSLIQFNRFNIWGKEREGPFNANPIGDFSYRESGSLASALALDNIAFKTLDTSLVSFYNLVIDSDVITSLEFREFLLACQLIVYKLNCVHDFWFKGGKGREMELDFARPTGQF